jgi:beta-lactamase regulating signal transducer with metallopeptidase domain
MGFLLAISLRSLALAATIGVLLAILRVRSAAARHAVWTLVTAGMLAIAIASATLPDVPLRVLNPAVASKTPAPTVITALKTPLRIPTHASPWPVLYSLGFLVCTARLMYGFRITRRLLRASVPIPRLDRVYESAHIAVPLNIGRRVLLPTDWPTWDAAKLDAVLTHERTHIARADWPIATMAALNRCVFWFHPLAWWLDWRLRTLAEQACDDASLAHIARDTYARTLVEIAAALRGPKHRVAWNALAMAKGAEIRMRIDRILDETRPIARPFTRSRWAALALAALPVVYFAAVARPARVLAQQAPALPARYFIQGEVLRPGEYKFTVPTKVLKALVDAGGFRDGAQSDDIVIIGERGRLHFNYREVIRGINREQNVFLQPGDTIVVR